MDATALCRLTIGQLAELIRTREVSPVEATEAALARAEALDGNYNAFIALWRDAALQAAREAERDIADGTYRGPLHGVPIALKDIFATQGQIVTNGSRIYADAVSDYDATVVARLRAAGAIFMGSLNLYQFACGQVMNPDFGPVRNAWNRDHIAGGSSSGSGTAVAADMCFGSLGTDTGGSIRIPAVLNGIVGLKPTYGRVSRHGVFPLSGSMDHVGPLTKEVRDTALMMNVIAGYDPNDPTTSKIPVPDYTASLIGDIDALRVGMPQPYFFEALQPSVRNAVSQAMDQLVQLGGLLEEQTLTTLDEAPEVLWTLISGDAGVVHETHLAAHADILDSDVRQLAERGSTLEAKDYIKAQQARDEIKHQMAAALERVDVLVTPTSPIVSPRLGDDTVEIGGNTVPMRPMLRRLTLPFNLSGFPACTIPCGMSPDGLPIGLQIIGKPFDEATVLRVAHAYELSTNWHQQRPVTTGRAT
jgi:aspartyl-tRNA(Asn)/glutamyl-tRNA(Gln) amidotransferase subunit A